MVKTLAQNFLHEKGAGFYTNTYILYLLKLHQAFPCPAIKLAGYFLYDLSGCAGSLTTIYPSSVIPESTMKCPFFVNSPGLQLMITGLPDAKEATIELEPIPGLSLHLKLRCLYHVWIKYSLLVMKKF